MRPNRRPVLALFVLAAVGAAPARGDEPRVADALRPFVDSGTLAGAVVAVASPDRVLTVEAVGYSDLAAGTPMRVDDLFWIASMSKPMTATALLMLVDEGKVRLDDPAEKYLPEFRGQMLVAEKEPARLVLKPPARPITVRDLLSHTSGLVGKSPLEGHLDSLTLREGVITYALSPLQFEPGTKYEYCNPGINTAGRIIEVVSGIPYQRFMQERLFGPLGMKDTTFWPTEAQVKRLAKSYKPDAAKLKLEEMPIGQLTYPLTDRSRQPYPGGGLFSTAADVATFCRMILNGGALDGRRYVSGSAVREMTSTQTGDLINQGKGEHGYGLGWSTGRKARGGESGPAIPGPCGHGGAHATHMGIDPEKKLVTVFMVQHGGYPGPDGGKVQPAFTRAAFDAYAGKK